MRILMTGGSGLLGTEILKCDSNVVAPSRAELDILDADSIERALGRHTPEVILHCAAATKPPEHAELPDLGLNVNIVGTANLARCCIRSGSKLVYTSTDYLYFGPGPHAEAEPVTAPYNFGWSKLGGECAVRLVPKHLILRLSFGPVPFPWERVYDEQYSSKLYVDEMAPLVLAAAKSGAEGVMNLGGPRTSLAAYARRTRPGIETMQTPAWVPKDTSLDLERMKRELGIRDEQALLRYKAS
jgi:dTDP-4-dehydrorhamnose reductase